MTIPGGRQRRIVLRRRAAIRLALLLLPGLPAAAQIAPSFPDSLRAVRASEGFILPPEALCDSARPTPLAFVPLPPSDVLTPNKRRNTPYLKIAVRVGGNWTSYSNDRYLDNTALDVGKTSGEDAIYSQAGGFGTGAGVEMEYPLNSVASLVGGIDFVIAHVGNSGPVDQTSVDAAGNEVVSPASHEFSLTMRCVRIDATFKLTFTSFHLVGGLAASSMMSSQLQRTRRINAADRYFPGTRQQEIVEDGPLPDPVGLHFSYRIGIGRSYQIGERLQFAPELVVDVGLNRLNKSKQSDMNIYAINAVLRYELR